MTTEIIKPGSTEVATTQPMDPMEIWNSIAAMAINPDVDANKIGALLDFQERIMDRAARDAYTLAKNTAMATMPSITKDKRIEHKDKQSGKIRLVGRYKTYDDLRRAIDPVLTPLGLRISHDPGFSEALKMPTVTAVLSFVKDGMAWTEKGGAFVLPFDATGAKSGAQGAGSSLSYGSRYTTCAMLGIVFEGEDNDGAGSQPESPPSDVLTESRLAASRGIEPYQDWFMQQTTIQKTGLVRSGEHDKNKEAAAEFDGE